MDSPAIYAEGLVKHFGSVRRIRQASVHELTEVPGVGPSTARAVLAALGGTGLGGTEQPDPDEKTMQSNGATS